MGVPPPRQSSELCKDIDHCRTLDSIIWSCIATLVACTWVSVHPNVPSPHHGTTTLILRRIRLMLLAIIAPEIIVLWALRQRMVARDLEKKFDIPIVHGFFVSMGGVVQPKGYNLHPIASHLLAEDVEMRIYDRGNGASSRPQTVVSGIKIPVEPLVHIQEIIDIDHREIRDRSKSDGISKGIAFLQTLWFMIQCIARAQQHLPLTELEVVTLAFASLNVIIRLIWWNKPLDVGFPIKISPPKEDLPRTTPAAVGAFTWNRFLRRPIATFVDFILMLFEGEVEDSHIPVTATRVPTLWAGRLSRRKRARAAAISIALAMGFGGIHFAAWNLAFPSNQERTLWRVASAIVVVVPFILFVGATIVLSLGGVEGWYHRLVFRVIIPLNAFTYIIARVILMVLPFISLRFLPLEAYRDVDWVSFIPHVS